MLQFMAQVQDSTTNSTRMATIFLKKLTKILTESTAMKTEKSSRILKTKWIFTCRIRIGYLTQIIRQTQAVIGMWAAQTINRITRAIISTTGNNSI